MFARQRGFGLTILRRLATFRGMNLKQIEDRSLIEHMATIGRDGIDRFLLARGRFRLAVLHGTLLVNQMRRNHGLGILETLILGHAYMAAALMATSLKGRERLGIQISCRGPVGGLHVESSARGEVRGYLSNSSIPIEAPLESFDTSEFFGEGTITVTRTPERPDAQPYTGRIELLHGNLAQDLTRYYAVSEQTPTALALSVKFDRQGAAVGAGGLLLQTMPGRDGREPSAETESPERYDEAVAEIEGIVRSLPSLGVMFSEGKSPTEVVREHFADFVPLYIGNRGVEFSCDCNRERFGRFLAALPHAEIEDIQKRGPFPLKITCHNCGSSYFFSEEEIRALG